MRTTSFDRLHKLRAMSVRCRRDLGDDFGTVVRILDGHIRDNRPPSASQRRIRGQVDAVCGGEA